MGLFDTRRAYLESEDERAEVERLLTDLGTDGQESEAPSGANLGIAHHTDGIGSEPELFRNRRPGFVTGLEEGDFRTSSSVEHIEGEFPLVDVMSRRDFIEALMRGDAAALAELEDWRKSGQKYLLGALGFALHAEGAHELGDECLISSGKLGNEYAHLLLGWAFAERGDTDKGRVYLERAAAAGYASAGASLAQMSAAAGDELGAIKWLIKAARGGDSASTSRLATMVDDEAESQMLARISRIQEASESPPDVDDPYETRFGASSISMDEYFTWPRLLALTDSEAMRTWWRDYGDFLPFTERDALHTSLADWHRDFQLPSQIATAHLAEAAAPWRRTQNNRLLDRINAAAERAGIARWDKADRFAGSWQDVHGNAFIQHAFTYTDEAGREFAYWAIDIMASPSYFAPLERLHAQQGLAALWLTAAYMAESKMGSKVGRDTAFPTIEVGHRPQPFVRCTTGEWPAVFPTPAIDNPEEPDACHCGSVFSIGYLVGADLTDAQLESALTVIVDVMVLAHSAFTGSEEPSLGPSLQDLKLAVCMREQHFRQSAPGADQLRLKLDSLRLAAGLRSSDEIWSAYGETMPLGLGATPRELDEVREAVRVMESGQGAAARSRLQPLADRGIGAALDSLGGLEEQEGKQQTALLLYRKAAATGDANGMNNYAGWLLQDDPSPESHWLGLGLLLSAALLGNESARRNLAQASPGMLTERMMLSNRSLLNSIAHAVQEEVSTFAALPLFDRAAKNGDTAAFASLTWTALLENRVEDGIQYFEQHMDSCLQAPAIDEYENGWHWERANALSNYAMLLLARNNDVEKAEAIWTETSTTGHPESIAGLAVLALRRGEANTATAIMANLQGSTIRELEAICSEFGDRGGWLRSWAQDMARVLPVTQQRRTWRARRESTAVGQNTAIDAPITREAANRAAAQANDAGYRASEQGNGPEAERFYHQAIGSDSDASIRATAVNNLVYQLLLPQNRFDDALPLLQAAISWDAGYQSRNALSNLGVLHYSRGELSAAEAAFKAVVSGWLGPVDEALHYLAKIAADLGDKQMHEWYRAQFEEFCPESGYLDMPT